MFSPPRRVENRKRVEDWTEKLNETSPLHCGNREKGRKLDRETDRNFSPSGWKSGKGEEIRGRSPGKKPGREA